MVTAPEGYDAWLAPAGEDESGELVAAGEPVRIGWPELGYYAMLGSKGKLGRRKHSTAKVGLQG